MQDRALQAGLGLSQGKLGAAAALALACAPVAIVSILPEIQFAGAMPTGLAVLLALIGFAWVVWNNASLQTQRSVAVLVFAIFALRLGVALGIGRWWWWPQALATPGNDWDVYEMLGWDLAQSGLSIEELIRYPLNEVGIVYLVGALYSIVGRNPLVLTVFFTFLGAWTALILADLVALTGGRKAASRSAILASLMPASLFLGAVPAKDILVTLCFVKLILIVLRIQGPHGWTVGEVGKAFALVFIMGTVRATAVPLLLVSLVGILAFVAPQARRRLIVLTVVLVLAGYGVLAWREAELERGASLSPMLVSQLAYDRTGRQSATLSEVGFTFATDEASSIALKTYWDGEVSRAYLIPLRAALMIFVPFPPTSFSTLDMAVGSLNTLLMLLLAPAVWGAIAYRDGGWRASLPELSWLWLPLVVHVMALSAMLPFVQMRYSLLSQFLFVGLAVVGMRKANRLAASYLLLPVVLAVLFLLYITIKSS